MGPVPAVVIHSGRELSREEGLRLREFTDTISELWPLRTDAPTRARGNAQRRANELVRLWTSAETQQTIRGSRWAALMAVTEYLDHYQPAKTPDVRARRVIGSCSVMVVVGGGISGLAAAASLKRQAPDLRVTVLEASPSIGGKLARLDVEAAKALCVPCPLREACLAGALERREPWGVWGGQLVVAGVVVPRKRPRGRPRKVDVAA